MDDDAVTEYALGQFRKIAALIGGSRRAGSGITAAHGAAERQGMTA
jgi:hypothetical protein